jgi:hypothetical protein
MGLKVAVSITINLTNMVLKVAVSIGVLGGSLRYHPQFYFCLS